MIQEEHKLSLAYQSASWRSLKREQTARSARLQRGLALAGVVGLHGDSFGRRKLDVLPDMLANRPAS